MIRQVGGFQGCYLDNHRNNWRCARAVRKRPLSRPGRLVEASPHWAGALWYGCHKSPPFLGLVPLPTPFFTTFQMPHRQVKVLVIDEISMVDAEFFDWYMDAVPKGAQLIFCGDFVQLPPVPDRQNSLDNEEHLRDCVFGARRKDNSESRAAAGAKDPAVDDPGRPNGGWLDMAKHTPFGLRETTGKYAFQAVAWREARLSVMHLRTVHRTREPLLLDGLTDMRAGVADSERIRALVAATARPLAPRDGVEPTTLYPKKRDVHHENGAKLAGLDAATRQCFRARDTVGLHEHAPPWISEEKLLGDAFFREDCQAAKDLELRLGAQVVAACEREGRGGGGGCGRSRSGRGGGGGGGAGGGLGVTAATEGEGRSPGRCTARTPLVGAARVWAGMHWKGGGGYPPLPPPLPGRPAYAQPSDAQCQLQWHL